MMWRGPFSRHIINAASFSMVASLSVSAGLAEKAPVQHIYGPPPEWENLRTLAERSIIRRLIDPESARITWIGGYWKGEFKPFLQSRLAGYIGCGTVNAKNRMGGYTGAQNFAIVFDYSRILWVEMDGSSQGAAWSQCSKAAQAGLIPPLSSSETGGSARLSPPPAPVATATGLTLRQMPEGAYVTAVAAGSPAEISGFKPGMVVTAVNGVPLRDMGNAMVKIVDAAGPDAMLDIVGGRAIKLGKRP